MRILAILSFILVGIFSHAQDVECDGVTSRFLEDKYLYHEAEPIVFHHNNTTAFTAFFVTKLEKLQSTVLNIAFESGTMCLKKHARIAIQVDGENGPINLYANSTISEANCKGLVSLELTGKYGDKDLFENLINYKIQAVQVVGKTDLQGEFIQSIYLPGVVSEKIQDAIKCISSL